MFRELITGRFPMVLLVPIAIVFLLAGSSYAQDSNLIEAAKKEGNVMAYGSFNSKTFKSIQKAFEKKYGIKTGFFRGNVNTLMDRAMSEFRTNKVIHDVVTTSAVGMALMKKEGMFTRYVSPSNQGYDKKIIDPFFGPAFRYLLIGIVYNTKMVKPEDAPKSYEDLLDPKWKGKITISDPSRHTTATTWFSSLHRVMGSKGKANEWIKSFAAQKPMLGRHLRVSMKQIVSGETPVGIVYLHYVDVFGKKGAPVDYVKGLSSYLGDASYIGLSSKSPRPNAGKLFIDFFLNDESTKIMANMGEFANRAGAKLSLPGAKEAAKRFVQMDAMTKDQYVVKKKEFKKIFKR